VAKRVSTDLFRFDAEDEAVDPSAEQEAKTPSEAHEGPKHAVGFYFAQDTIDALDMAAATLRRGAKTRSKVTKSAIVEFAVRTALQDLERNGANSMIAKMLTN
jgi:hypothetical protein